ncbi:MAG: hypothetical protein HKM05_10440 [Spirochaetales bacterium]|nr:hypothetical protein [Spirochaetales bacterium]
MTKLEVIRDGEKQEWDVCRSCLTILLGETPPEEKKICPQCGFSWDEVQHTRRLGCPDCYTTFASWLEERSRRRGWPVYHGERPAWTVNSSPLARQERMAQLQTELKSAVEGELFEKAAQLRDEIRALQELL